MTWKKINLYFERNKSCFPSIKKEQKIRKVKWPLQGGNIRYNIFAMQRHTRFAHNRPCSCQHSSDHNDSYFPKCLLKNASYMVIRVLDRWRMTCDFTPFSTVFQSYQDDGKLIMKGCAMELRLRLRRFAPRAGIELGPLDQKASA